MERLEIFLEKQLEKVDKWLHFAEAKNAALIAINVAIASMSFGSNTFVIYLIRILLIISSIIALISFWPNSSSNTNKKQLILDVDGTNYLFYADIAKYSSEEQYLRLVMRDYFNENKESVFSEMCLDYAKEILINSKIAVWKYKLFKIALCFDLASFGMMIVCFVCA